MDGCDNQVPIRSTIKTGQYEGKKVCQQCKNRLEPKEKAPVKIKQITEKTREKKKLRSGRLQEFYKLASLKAIAAPRCQNCGRKINSRLHVYNNLAHILSKRSYPSVMDHPDNLLILCSSKDDPVGGIMNDCHHDFDSNLSKREQMPVFQMALEKYKKFRGKVEENGREKELFEKHIENEIQGS